MKILLLSDREDPYLWDFYKPGRLDGIDLVLSCGDLKAEYLSFIVTMGRAPVLYVCGNHDGGYGKKPPEGCDCIEDTLYNFNGLRILGLGGCAVYNEGPNQYTERNMKSRVSKLSRKIRRAGGVDILLTHAPAAGCNDGPDYAHRGFETFNDVIEKYHPAYHVHGHVHLNYGAEIPRLSDNGGTTVINACGRYVLEI